MDTAPWDPRSCRIVIPTRDSRPWILQLLTAYRRLGVEPLYVVDTRSTDGTERLLSKAGAEIIPFEPHADFVEAGMLARASQAIEADWILRLDDDEFPSIELLRWVQATGCRSSVAAWGLSRRDLIRLDGQIGYSRHWSHYYLPDNPTYLNPQFRLYRHRAVTYVEIIHTAGYKVRNPDFAPETAYFVHLDILIRSMAERLAKIRRYETIKPDFGWRFADQYLPEFLPTQDLALGALDSTEFDALIASLPTHDEHQSFTLTTNEIRRMRAGNFDRDEHAARVAALRRGERT